MVRSDGGATPRRCLRASTRRWRIEGEREFGLTGIAEPVACTADCKTDRLAAPVRRRPRTATYGKDLYRRRTREPHGCVVEQLRGRRPQRRCALGTCATARGGICCGRCRLRPALPHDWRPRGAHGIRCARSAEPRTRPPRPPRAAGACATDRPAGVTNAMPRRRSA